MTSNADRWERFLDPDVVRPSLFMATMFVTTFEILQDCIVDRIRDFYINGFDQTGLIVGPDYQKNVASRSRSILYASLDWLKEYEVINDHDLETFEQLKKIRNQLAHQLFDVVTGQVESDHQAQFEVLFELLRKIEVWWVINVELATNPDYDNQEIDKEGIVPGAILSLQMLIQVATGNTELLEAWRKERVSRGTDA
ncbi:hypothetical protein [Oxalicibacterium faecigallinarum]|uniref:Uncharacterized protein n=1 Tax=Oxalicibacterium faecigallinarum TaxID=573741 RepID=A0A8J3ASX2_9BURK|nr:hypothetical protein [Oxalicibacterium faecigallinarum]GGI20632.1 hypothetical protein GCM10008066_25000 [Oxalicibacterium faecigallinarum]